MTTYSDAIIQACKDRIAWYSEQMENPTGWVKCTICETFTPSQFHCSLCPLWFEGKGCLTGDLSYMYKKCHSKWTYYTIKDRRDALIKRFAKNGVYV